MEDPAPGPTRGNSVLRKSDWVLTQSSFRELLTWLDEGKDSGGHSYLEMRRRLVQYFDRKNCASPDELADETLNRVARRLEEEGTIVSEAPAQYCYVVARYVFLESSRQKSSHASLPAALSAPPDLSDEKNEIEKRSMALEKCLRALHLYERALITGYYQGQQREKIENRKRLAANLKLTINALSIRACRIRDKLEACVRESLGGTK